MTVKCVQIILKEAGAECSSALIFFIPYFMKRNAYYLYESLEKKCVMPQT